MIVVAETSITVSERARRLFLELSATGVLLTLLYVFIADPLLLPVIAEYAPVDSYPRAVNPGDKVSLTRSYDKRRDCDGVGTVAWYQRDSDGNWTLVQRPRSYAESLQPGRNRISITITIPDNVQPGKELHQRYEWTHQCSLIPIKTPMETLVFEVIAE